MIILIISFIGSALIGCGGSEKTEEVQEETTEAEKEEDGSEDNSGDKPEESETDYKSDTKSLFGSNGNPNIDNDDEESDDVNGLSDEEAEKLAAFLSIDEDPSIGDWEFIDGALSGGQDHLMELFDDPDAVVIHNPLLTEGGWKCVTCPIPNTYNSDMTYLGKANINTLNDKVSFTFDMWVEMEGIFDGGGKEITDGSPVKYVGTWNDDMKGFTAGDDSMMINMTKFIYLDDTMYGVGKLDYISGEQDYVVLIRPYSKMEVKYYTGEEEPSAESSGTVEETEQNSGGQDTKKTEQKTSGSSGLSTEEILERAKKKSGAPIAEIDSVDPDGTLNIHLFEDMGDHTATWDWYYIDPKTAKGYNLLGEAVDLN